MKHAPDDLNCERNIHDDDEITAIYVSNDKYIGFIYYYYVRFSHRQATITQLP